MLLVSDGWQKVKSIEDQFYIIFPELFCDSYLLRTNQKLLLGYTSTQKPEAEFQIVYTMQQTLSEAEEQLLLAGADLKQELEKNRTAYVFIEEGITHQGCLVEVQYSVELLGSTFGEEGSVTGVMRVELIYPEAETAEYQQETYHFYVIDNREED